jgi:hypothetical protein
MNSVHQYMRAVHLVVGGRFWNSGQESIEQARAVVRGGKIIFRSMTVDVAKEELLPVRHRPKEIAEKSAHGGSVAA